MDSLTKRTAGSAIVLLDEIVLHPLRWIPWWYTRGLVDLGRRVLGTEARWLESLGLRVILTNLFVPMFGDYSRSGRVISFFARLVLLFFKGLFFVVVTIFLALGTAFYLALPPFVALQLVYQFGGPRVL